MKKSKAVASGKTRKINKGRVRPKPPRAYLPAAQRRKLIIAAAQEVFARTNLQGARTRDIARAAEVNQATIFEHFESKKAASTTPESRRSWIITFERRELKPRPAVHTRWEPPGSALPT